MAKHHPTFPLLSLAVGAGAGRAALLACPFEPLQSCTWGRSRERSRESRAMRPLDCSFQRAQEKRAGEGQLGSCGSGPSSGRMVASVVEKGRMGPGRWTPPKAPQSPNRQGTWARNHPGRWFPLRLSGFNAAQPSSCPGSTGQEDANPTPGCGSAVKTEGKAINLPQNTARRHFTWHLCWEAGRWTTSEASCKRPGFPPAARAVPGQGFPPGLQRAPSSSLSPKGVGHRDRTGQRVPRPPGRCSAKLTACTGNRKPSARSPAGDGKARLWAETMRPQTERLQHFKTGHDGYSGLKRHGRAF